METDAGDIVGALRAQQDELRGLITGLDDDGWAKASPCEGWDVADVVLHLAQTNEMAIASARGHYAETLDALTAGLAPTYDVDEGAAAMVERDRGAGNAAILERWQCSVDDLRDAIESGDPHERVQWVAGTLSVRTLTTTRLAETWIHTTDVADALGIELAPTDRLRHIARLAWRTLPYAFQRAGKELSGAVAFDLTGPNGDAWAFGTGEGAPTTIAGAGVELCMVAARRVDPSATGLRGDGPDAADVLALVRTYA